MKINGKSTVGEKFGGVLMAFDLEPGEYQIEMKNRPKGATIGAILSAGGILLFISVILLHRRKNMSKKKASGRKQGRPLAALPAEEPVIDVKAEDEIPDLDALDDPVTEEEGGELQDEI